MLPAGRVRGCETDPQRLLSMLGSLGGGGAESSSEQKGAFILQAPAPSNGQERQGLVCALATRGALSHAQMLRSTERSLGGGGAERSSEQKGAFILQAPAPSNGQERQGLVCPLATRGALSHALRLCFTEH